jgi:hypothetical protein
MCGGKVKGVIPGEPELILEYFRLIKIQEFAACPSD